MLSRRCCWTFRTQIRHRPGAFCPASGNPQSWLSPSSRFPTGLCWAALRSLDYQTTVKAMSDPANFHELVLPQALVDSHIALGSFEAGTVVANYWIYRELVRRGHGRLARIGQAVNLGALAGTVAFNEYNLAEYDADRPRR